VLEDDKPRIRSRLLFAASLVLSILVATESAAQPRDPKKAEELFQEGKKQFEANNFQEACSKLAQSEQLDPAIGTLGLLAACHEKQGKIATAWSEYRETQDRARKAGDTREAYAKERAEALEPQVPRVRVVALGNEAGLQATIDAKPVGRLGEAMPIDPGDHELVASAPGKKERRTKFTVSAGARTDQTIAPLDSAEPGPVLGAERGPAATPSGETAQLPAPDQGGSGDSRRTVAFVAGGIGVAGVVVGSIFGIMAISKKGEVDDEATKNHCTPPNHCPSAALARIVDLNDSFSTLSMVSNVGFIVGGLGLATGVVLYLTAPKSSESGTALRVTPQGAWVTGRF